MKAIIFLFSAMSLCSVATLQAQTDGEEEDRRTKIEVGAKVGLNVSNVWDSEGEDFQADPKLGLAGGVFIGIPINTWIGVQPEILFSQKGLQGSGTLLSFPYSFTRTASYIDIPLQLQIKPTKFLTVVVGPQYSYLLKTKTVYTFASNSVDQEEEFNNDNIRRNVLGAVGGIDVIVKGFVVSARGGLDFQTNNGNGTTSTPRYKNVWLQLTVGYKL
jgi:hypothetical protein